MAVCQGSIPPDLALALSTASKNHTVIAYLKMRKRGKKDEENMKNNIMEP